MNVRIVNPEGWSSSGSWVGDRMRVVGSRGGAAVDVGVVVGVV